MQKQTLIFAGLLSFAVATPIFAQTMQEKVSNWYWQERFVVADANEDALLEKVELGKFATEFSYYLEAKNFQLSDENHDGFLSYQEMLSRKEAEANYRISMESRQIRSLEAANQGLANADVQFLKNNSVLTMTLFSNFTWMIQHADLAEKLYSDKLWMATHTSVSNALHHNLCWMASNPKSAKVIYEAQKTASPELLGWRADHLKFIRQNPALETHYQLEGFQAIIKVGKK